MKAAILYTGKYGSTKKYAYWINEHTYFPVFDLGKENPNPDDYDLIILGSSIISMRPTIRQWLKKNWNRLKEKPVLFFTVSGAAPDDPDLQKWLDKSLGREILDQLHHVPLRGRLLHKDLPWWIRGMLKMASRVEKNPEIKKRMAEGFDYMDKQSIVPILDWVETKQDGKQEVQLAI